MEQSIIEPSYFAIFIQWALLFGLIGTCIIPAILFTNLARKHNKKGWIYLIIGLGVGVVLLAITGFVLQLLRTSGFIDNTQHYLIILFFALPIVGTLAVLRILKTSFISRR